MMRRFICDFLIPYFPFIWWVLSFYYFFKLPVLAAAPDSFLFLLCTLYYSFLEDFHSIFIRSLNISCSPYPLIFYLLIIIFPVFNFVHCYSCNNPYPPFIIYHLHSFALKLPVLAAAPDIWFYNKHPPPQFNFYYFSSIFITI